MPTHSEHLRYLRLLAQQFPTVAAAASEIIRIEAVLQLPKGTEHFMSDLHGEHEAFVHILNSASGVIREKIDTVLGDSVSPAERGRPGDAHLLPGPEAARAESPADRSGRVVPGDALAAHRAVPVCLQQAHPGPCAGGSAGELCLHPGRIAPRPFRGPRQGPLLRPDHRQHAAPRPGGRLHHAPVRDHQVAGGGPAAHCGGPVRPWPPAGTASSTA